MAASDHVPVFFKNRLHLAGRPQMSTRPRQAASFLRTVDNPGTYAQSLRWNHRLDRALMTTRYQTRQDLQAASAEAREQAPG
jgi:hypothetical protein